MSGFPKTTKTDAEQVYILWQALNQLRNCGCHDCGKAADHWLKTLRRPHE